jgi:hypothetical protein
MLGFILVTLLVLFGYNWGYQIGYERGYKIGIDSCDPMLNGQWRFYDNRLEYTDNYTHEVNP